MVTRNYAFDFVKIQNENIACSSKFSTSMWEILSSYKLQIGSSRGLCERVLCISLKRKLIPVHYLSLYWLALDIMATLHVFYKVYLSTKRFTRRRNNNSDFPFAAINKIRPLVDVPLPWQARFWHLLNLCNRQHVIPDVDVCHHSHKALCCWEATSRRILLLTKRYGSSCLYNMTTF